MSRPAGNPLTRITINLFADDLVVFRRRFPTGYQEVIRKLVHLAAREIEADETLTYLEKQA